MAAFTRAALVCLLAARAAGFLRSRVGGSTDVQYAHAKFVFFAGLEGTGHHVFSAVLHQCMEAGACGQLPRQFYKSVYRHSLTPNVKEMRKVFREAEVADNVVYPLNPFVQGNMMSYPTTSRKQNPHMKELYHTVKHFGHSFKVVVMLRDPRDLLRSDAGRWSHTEDDLLASLDEMSAQLRELPADTYTCVSYEELGKVGGEFLEFIDLKNFSLGGALNQLFQGSPGCDEDCDSADRLMEADRKFRKEFCPNAADPLLADLAE